MARTFPDHRRIIVGLFSKPKDPAPLPEPQDAAGQGPRKDRPTPTRREAEAARMARLHPELDPKKAKQLDRESRQQVRVRQMAAVDATPERQLIRDVVDSRWNVGEIALPVMLIVLVIFLVPALEQFAQWSIFPMYAVIALLVLDYLVMWRKFKRLAAERIPTRPLRGLGFYGWNRQMSFRRWRQPAPRVRRGDPV